MKTKHIISLLKVFTVAAITVIAPAYGAFILLSSFAIGALGSGLALSTFDPAGLTFTAKEVAELGQAVLEKFYKKPEVKDIFMVVPGVKAKMKIGFLGQLGLVGRKGSDSDCVPPTSTEKISATEKEWDPEMIEDRFVDCWKDLKDSFWIWGLKNGIEKGDLTGTDYYNFLIDRLSDAAYSSFLRHAFFGDEAMDNASGGGYLVNGVDADYFNAINGIWTQLITIAIANPLQNIVIDRNDQNTYSTQAFTSGAASDQSNGVIKSTFRQMLENADTRLSESEGLQFLVTKSIYDQYLNELEYNQNSIEAAFMLLQNGTKTLTYRGVPVIAIPEWDRIIRTYLKDGTKYYIPHRAILTVPKEQLALGVEGENDWANFRTWFEKKDNSTYTDIGWMEDAKVREDYMVMVALGADDLS